MALTDKDQKKQVKRNKKMKKFSNNQSAFEWKKDR
jgi:hypothetical protein